MSEQIYAKYLQRFDAITSRNDQHGKSSTDAITIQAVANCLNLSIHIAESNETFNPMTIVRPMNVTSGCTKIYIAHIAETCYMSVSFNK